MNMDMSSGYSRDAIDLGSNMIPQHYTGPGVLMDTGQSALDPNSEDAMKTDLGPAPTSGKGKKKKPKSESCEDGEASKPKKKKRSKSADTSLEVLEIDGETGGVKVKKKKKKKEVSGSLEIGLNDGGVNKDTTHSFQQPQNTNWKELDDNNVTVNPMAPELLRSWDEDSSIKKKKKKGEKKKKDKSVTEDLDDLPVEQAPVPHLQGLDDHIPLGQDNRDFQGDTVGLDVSIPLLHGSGTNDTSVTGPFSMDSGAHSIQNQPAKKTNALDPWDLDYTIPVTDGVLRLQSAIKKNEDGILESNLNEGVTTNGESKPKKNKKKSVKKKSDDEVGTDDQPPLIDFSDDHTSESQQPSEAGISSPTHQNYSSKYLTSTPTSESQQTPYNMSPISDSVMTTVADIHDVSNDADYLQPQSLYDPATPTKPIPSPRQKKKPVFIETSDLDSTDLSILNSGEPVSLKPKKPKPKKRTKKSGSADTDGSIESLDHLNRMLPFGLNEATPIQSTPDDGLTSDMDLQVQNETEAKNIKKAKKVKGEKSKDSKKKSVANPNLEHTIEDTSHDPTAAEILSVERPVSVVLYSGNTIMDTGENTEPSAMTSSPTQHETKAIKETQITAKANKDKGGKSKKKKPDKDSLSSKSIENVNVGSMESEIDVNLGRSMDGCNDMLSDLHRGNVDMDVEDTDKVEEYHEMQPEKADKKKTIKGALKGILKKKKKSNINDNSKSLDDINYDSGDNTGVGTYINKSKNDSTHIPDKPTDQSNLQVNETEEYTIGKESAVGGAEESVTPKPKRERKDYSGKIKKSKSRDKTPDKSEGNTCSAVLESIEALNIENYDLPEQSYQMSNDVAMNSDPHILSDVPHEIPTDMLPNYESTNVTDEEKATKSIKKKKDKGDKGKKLKKSKSKELVTTDSIENIYVYADNTDILLAGSTDLQKDLPVSEIAIDAEPDIQQSIPVESQIDPTDNNNKAEEDMAVKTTKKKKEKGEKKKLKKSKSKELVAADSVDNLQNSVEDPTEEVVMAESMEIALHDQNIALKTSEDLVVSPDSDQMIDLVPMDTFSEPQEGHNQDPTTKQSKVCSEKKKKSKKSKSKEDLNKEDANFVAMEMSLIDTELKDEQTVPCPSYDTPTQQGGLGGATDFRDSLGNGILNESELKNTACPETEVPMILETALTEGKKKKLHKEKKKRSKSKDRNVSKSLENINSELVFTVMDISKSMDDLSDGAKIEDNRSEQDTSPVKKKRAKGEKKGKLKKTKSKDSLTSKAQENIDIIDDESKQIEVSSSESHVMVDQGVDLDQTGVQQVAEMTILPQDTHQITNGEITSISTENQSTPKFEKRKDNPKKEEKVKKTKSKDNITSKSLENINSENMYIVMDISKSVDDLSDNVKQEHQENEQDTGNQEEITDYFPKKKGKGEKKTKLKKQKSKEVVGSKSLENINAVILVTLNDCNKSMEDLSDTARHDEDQEKKKKKDSKKKKKLSKEKAIDEFLPTEKNQMPEETHACVVDFSEAQAEMMVPVVDDIYSTKPVSLTQSGEATKKAGENKAKKTKHAKNDNTELDLPTYSTEQGPTCSDLVTSQGVQPDAEPMSSGSNEQRDLNNSQSDVFDFMDHKYSPVNAYQRVVDDLKRKFSSEDELDEEIQKRLSQLSEEAQNDRDNEELESLDQDAVQSTAEEIVLKKSKKKMEKKGKKKKSDSTDGPVVNTDETIVSTMEIGIADQSEQNLSSEATYLIVDDLPIPKPLTEATEEKKRKKVKRSKSSESKKREPNENSVASLGLGAHEISLEDTDAKSKKKKSKKPKKGDLDSSFKILSEAESLGFSKSEESILQTPVLKKKKLKKKDKLAFKSEPSLLCSNMINASLGDAEDFNTHSDDAILSNKHRVKPKKGKKKQENAAEDILVDIQSGPSVGQSVEPMLFEDDTGYSLTTPEDSMYGIFQYNRSPKMSVRRSDTSSHQDQDMNGHMSGASTESVDLDEDIPREFRMIYPRSSIHESEQSEDLMDISSSFTQLNDTDKQQDEAAGDNVCEDMKPKVKPRKQKKQKDQADSHMIDTTSEVSKHSTDPAQNNQQQENSICVYPSTTDYMYDRYKDSNLSSSTADFPSFSVEAESVPNYDDEVQQWYSNAVPQAENAKQDVSKTEEVVEQQATTDGVNSSEPSQIHDEELEQPDTGSLKRRNAKKLKKKKKDDSDSTKKKKKKSSKVSDSDSSVTTPSESTQYSSDGIKGILGDDDDDTYVSLDPQSMITESSVKNDELTDVYITTLSQSSQRPDALVFDYPKEWDSNGYTCQSESPPIQTDDNAVPEDADMYLAPEPFEDEFFKLGSDDQHNFSSKSGDPDDLDIDIPLPSPDPKHSSLSKKLAKSISKLKEKLSKMTTMKKSGEEQTASDFFDSKEMDEQIFVNDVSDSLDDSDQRLYVIQVRHDTYPPGWTGIDRRCTLDTILEEGSDGSAVYEEIDYPFSTVQSGHDYSQDSQRHTDQAAEGIFIDTNAEEGIYSEIPDDIIQEHTFIASQKDTMCEVQEPDSPKADEDPKSVDSSSDSLYLEPVPVGQLSINVICDRNSPPEFQEDSDKTEEDICLEEVKLKEEITAEEPTVTATTNIEEVSTAADLHTEPVDEPLVQLNDEQNDNLIKEEEREEDEAGISTEGLTETDKAEIEAVSNVEELPVNPGYESPIQMDNDLNVQTSPGDEEWVEYGETEVVLTSQVEDAKLLNTITPPSEEKNQEAPNSIEEYDQNAIRQYVLSLVDAARKRLALAKEKEEAMSADTVMDSFFSKVQHKKPVQLGASESVDEHINGQVGEKQTHEAVAESITPPEIQNQADEKEFMLQGTEEVNDSGIGELSIQADETQVQPLPEIVLEQRTLPVVNTDDGEEPVQTHYASRDTEDTIAVSNKEEALSGPEYVEQTTENSFVNDTIQVVAEEEFQTFAEEPIIPIDLSVEDQPQSIQEDGFQTDAVITDNLENSQASQCVALMPDDTVPKDLTQSKVVVLGPSRAGKSTLISRLGLSATAHISGSTNALHAPLTASTSNGGGSYPERGVHLLKIRGRNIRLTLQEVTGSPGDAIDEVYNNLQLTPQAIYLVLVNIAHYDTEAVESMLRYYYHMLTQRLLDPIICIVATHVDSVSHAGTKTRCVHLIDKIHQIENENVQYLDHQFRKIQEGIARTFFQGSSPLNFSIDSLKLPFENLKNIMKRRPRIWPEVIQVNCLQDRSIEGLRHTLGLILETYSECLPPKGTPEAWIQLQQDIMTLARASPFLSLDSFKRLSKQRNITDEDEVEEVKKYLNNVGTLVCLNKAKTKCKSDIIIHNFPALQSLLALLRQCYEGKITVSSLIHNSTTSSQAQLEKHMETFQDQGVLPIQLLHVLASYLDLTPGIFSEIPVLLQQMFVCPKLPSQHIPSYLLFPTLQKSSEEHIRALWSEEMEVKVEEFQILLQIPTLHHTPGMTLLLCVGAHSYLGHILWHEGVFVGTTLRAHGKVKVEVSHGGQGKVIRLSIKLPSSECMEANPILLSLVTLVNRTVSQHFPGLLYGSWYVVCTHCLALPEDERPWSVECFPADNILSPKDPAEKVQCRNCAEHQWLNLPQVFPVTTPKDDNIQTIWGSVRKTKPTPAEPEIPEEASEDNHDQLSEAEVTSELSQQDTDEEKQQTDEEQQHTDEDLEDAALVYMSEQIPRSPEELGELGEQVVTPSDFVGMVSQQLPLVERDVQQHSQEPLPSYTNIPHEYDDSDDEESLSDIAEEDSAQLEVTVLPVPTEDKHPLKAQVEEEQEHPQSHVYFLDPHHKHIESDSDEDFHSIKSYDSTPDVSSEPVSEEPTRIPVPEMKNKLEEPANPPLRSPQSLQVSVNTKALNPRDEVRILHSTMAPKDSLAIKSGTHTFDILTTIQIESDQESEVERYEAATQTFRPLTHSDTQTDYDFPYESDTDTLVNEQSEDEDVVEPLVEDYSEVVHYRRLEMIQQTVELQRPEEVEPLRWSEQGCQTDMAETRPLSITRGNQTTETPKLVSSQSNQVDTSITEPKILTESQSNQVDTSITEPPKVIATQSNQTDTTITEPPKLLDTQCNQTDTSITEPIKHMHTQSNQTDTSITEPPKMQVSQSNQTEDSEVVVEEILVKHSLEAQQTIPDIAWQPDLITSESPSQTEETLPSVADSDTQVSWWQLRTANVDSEQQTGVELQLKVKDNSVQAHPHDVKVQHAVGNQTADDITSPSRNMLTQVNVSDVVAMADSTVQVSPITADIDTQVEAANLTPQANMSSQTLKIQTIENESQVNKKQLVLAKDSGSQAGPQTSDYTMGTEPVCKQDSQSQVSPRDLVKRRNIAMQAHTEVSRASSVTQTPRTTSIDSQTQIQAWDLKRNIITQTTKNELMDERNVKAQTDLSITCPTSDKSVSFNSSDVVSVKAEGIQLRPKDLELSADVAVQVLTDKMPVVCDAKVQTEVSEKQDHTTQVDVKDEKLCHDVGVGITRAELQSKDDNAIQVTEVDLVPNDNQGTQVTKRDLLGTVQVSVFVQSEDNESSSYAQTTEEYLPTPIDQTDFTYLEQIPVQSRLPDNVLCDSIVQTEVEKVIPLTREWSTQTDPGLEVSHREQIIIPDTDELTQTPSLLMSSETKTWVDDYQPPSTPSSSPESYRSDLAMEPKEPEVPQTVDPFLNSCVTVIAIHHPVGNFGTYYPRLRDPETVQRQLQQCSPRSRDHNEDQFSPRYSVNSEPIHLEPVKTKLAPKVPPKPKLPARPTGASRSPNGLGPGRPLAQPPAVESKPEPQVDGPSTAFCVTGAPASQTQAPSRRKRTNDEYQYYGRY